ncbi:MAG TPA: 2-oxoglutarate dehydrogenase, E2 component, dihydrolipoamide succinyltransferase [Streptomyces sp.]|nr:2-oxoglutarate dehydrogenase, E2 component, dihydrolipoamide succinyltransferase [Streptomyces sp.]
MVLPALGESVTEGTVTRWLKAVGDSVEADEPLLEVSTDKVDTEIPSPVAGTLLEIKANEDDTVEVGAVLAVVGSSDESAGGGDTGDDGGQEAEEGQDQPAETPLDEEATERDAAHAQAEQADTPESPTTAEEPAPVQAQEQPEQKDEAPREEVAAATAGASQSSGEQTVVRLPELGESVTEGTVTRWLKQVGDQVAADESLLEVSTDKVDTEIPSPAAGTLLEIKVNEDETVEVGAELAVIGSDNAGQTAPEATSPAPAEQPEQAEVQPQEEQKQAEQSGQATAPEPAAEPEPPAQPAQPQQPAPSEQPAQQQAPEPAPEPAPAPQPAPAQPQAQAPAPAPAPAPAQPQAPAAPAQPAEADGAYVTPLVRKLASEQGVNLANVKGTGVGGRIRKQDVVAAAEAAKQSAPAPQAAAPAPSAAKPVEPSPLRGQTVKMPRIRKVIGDNMMKALHSQAQLSTVVEVDVTRIMKLRARAKEAFQAREGVKLSPMPFFVQAAAEALKAHPAINARINDDGTITYFDVENIGIAVDSEKGLMVPVIKEAGNLNLSGIARKTAELAGKVRGGGLGPDDMSGGTFTISNTGSRGALFDTIIVNYPQVAELGIGATVRRPVVVNHPELGETIAIRDMVYLTLSYDHQLVDGADAARYLADVKARLEAGEFEGELGL